MLAHPVRPHLADLARSPCFTLGTALVLLAHDCRGVCPEIATTHRAKVWFHHLPLGANTAWTETLVDVEFAGNLWTATLRRSLLTDINRCVRPDHMRVRARSADERKTFIAALNTRRAAERVH